MADMEKVIKGLEHCSNKSLCNDDCPYSSILRDPNLGIDECMTQLAHDALELLKEQSKIVRCEDCKHRPTYPKAYGAEINGHWCYWCELHRMWTTDDWFCADGERQ